MALAFGSFGKDVLPFRYWEGAAAKPVIFFLTGDGGINHFSEKLCHAWNQEGYSVIALNSRKYFLKRKTPAQLAADFGVLIRQKLQAVSSGLFYIIGYSFGADAVPFAVNQFPDDLKEKLKAVVMLEPSTSTDLKIHLADLLGRSTVKRSMDVVQEINRLPAPGAVLIFGEKENDFPVGKLTNNSNILFLPGDHHFNNDITRVAACIHRFLALSYPMSKNN